MMNAKSAALLQALDVLGATQAELAKSLSRSDDRRRHDLVAQRRALAGQTAQVGELANVLFEELGNAELLATYRRLSSAARSKAAIHQANWSAVRVGEFEDEYRKSAREAGKAHRLFSDWVRSVVVKFDSR